MAGISGVLRTAGRAVARGGLIVAAFIAGGLYFEHSAIERIPGVASLVQLVRPPVFYPGQEQDPSAVPGLATLQAPFTCIVYGDSREIASAAKAAIINRINEESPAFVIHLGDMVYCGDEHQWRIFDSFEGTIQRKGIPLFPVLGNHEYRSLSEIYPERPDDQLRFYFQRFPFLAQRRWYSFTCGQCRFLILDTGTDYSEGSPQYQWLVAELGRDWPGLLAVALHYPPHTRSAHGRREEKALASIFEADVPGRRKPDIVFSGHVHNYERYRVSGIQYVVSGGGGAPPEPVSRASSDAYQGSGATFHYCRISVTQSAYEFEMVRWNPETRQWSIGDAFTGDLGKDQGTKE